MNLILIPLYGPLGAAIASTVSTVFIFFIGLYVAQQLVHIDMLALTLMVMKLMMISLIMLLTVYVLGIIIPVWYIALVPAALLYVGGLFTAKILTIQDIKSLKLLLQR